MNYAKIKWVDVANGDGVRVSLFVSGCRNHCKGCFNPETWRFSYGDFFTPQVESKILKRLERKHIGGLSVLGGDPFEPENVVVLSPFLHLVKQMYPEKSTWVYTGYTYEKLSKNRHCKNMLRDIDVLVDGPFVEELKDLNLRFCGSSNQRILKLKDGEIVGEIEKYLTKDTPSGPSVEKCCCGE